MDGGERSMDLKTEKHASSKKDKAVVLPISSPHTENSRKDAATNSDRTGPSSTDILEFPDVSSSSSSSFSSSSSLDDFIHVDPQILLKSISQNNNPKPSVDKIPVYKTHGLDESLDSLEYMSRFSDITHESLVELTSITQSPPVQMMERAGNFDLDGIPAAVFSKASSSPKNWSVASNDSLFSIQLGTQSIDLTGSGYVFGSEELYRSVDFDKSGELCQYEGVKRSQDIGWEINMVEEGNARTTLKFIEPVQKDLGNANDSSIANHQADESEPVIEIPYTKKKKSSNPLSHCSDCCRAFYCCKWPNCRCKLSVCSCKWLSCSSCSSCSCKCFSWPCCSCKWMKSCSCKWLSCSGCSCKCFSWPCKSCSCKCFSKWLSCSGCSCKCFSWPCCSCKWLTGCSCKWLSCLSCSSCSKCTKSCCKLPRCHWKCSWPSFNCKCPKWLSCSCWNTESEESSTSDIIVSSPRKGFHESAKSIKYNSLKSSSRRRYCCFSSSCSCSFSCCW